MTNSHISIIAALGSGRTRVVGKDGELLWHIPDDLKRFKKLTLAHPVIMGRKTFESILRYLAGPLPGRANIVLTRNPHNDLRSRYGVEVECSLQNAIEKARLLDTEEIFIGGGAQVYAEALPLADRLYLTLIDDEKEGDSFFPPYEHLFKTVVAYESRERNGLHYRWVTLDR